MPVRSSLIVSLAVLLGLGGPLCDAACAEAPAREMAAQAHQAVPPCHRPAPEAPEPTPTQESCAVACDSPAVAQAPLPLDTPDPLVVVVRAPLPPVVIGPAVRLPDLRLTRLPPPDILLRKSTLNL